MSLEQAAKHLASHGRGPDTELIHMTKGEIRGLQQLAMAGGGSLTINPHTGLAEAGFLSKMLPMIAGAAAMYFSGGTAAPLIAGMSNAATIGLGMGAFETARTGSVQKGLMAGLGAYGGAGLAGGLMGAGAAELGKTAASGAVEEAGKQGLTGEAYNQAVQNSVADKMGSLSNFDKLSAGFSNPAASVNAMGGGTGLMKTGLMAAAPMLMAPTTKQPEIKSDNTMPQRLQYNVGRAVDAQGQPTTPMPDVPGYDNLGQDFGKQQNYFPTAGYQNITPEQAKAIRGYAEGGLNLSGEYSRDLNNDLENTYSKAERKNDKETMRSVKSEAALRERLKNPKMYAAGGIMPSQGGGPVEQMSNENAIGVNTGFPMASINKGAYATPYQTPQPQNIVQGAADTGINSMTGEMNEFARGGLSSASSNLGDYSDGGRLLKGPGDGVSDSIPATIGNKRPARLADGEFVVPARIVSELGNGSTEAGARKLYAMLDRVQSARKKSIGKGKVAKNSRADNLLPA
jgi:hypothetical protein